ncbi:MAG TPA: twin-arginine translocation signal domain-containing protein, partial [Acidobacteriota bacterium]|nr:twin-arginine translocation signal domain-containing protein [Acidobacteriota bacterium]
MKPELDRREFLKASAMAGVAGNMSFGLLASAGPGQDSAAWISALVVGRVANSPSNSIRNAESEKPGTSRWSASRGATIRFFSPSRSTWAPQYLVLYSTSRLAW